MNTKTTERLCPECRVGAHDHCACECDVCAHRYDHLLIVRAERAEVQLAKMMAALHEMRTTYERNRHAREWAHFFETALSCCGLCGQDVDSRFKHECPAHYVDFSSIKLSSPKKEHGV
jgi:hypothetical protein